jgi:hypothetical protein
LAIEINKTLTRIGPLDVQNKKIGTARGAPSASTVSLFFVRRATQRGDENLRFKIEPTLRLAKGGAARKPVAPAGAQGFAAQRVVQ